MTGKSHFAIGVATGAACTLYSVGTGNPIYALAMVTAPLGAMLPDIDHDRSKIGRVRNKTTNIIAKTIKIASIIFLLSFIIYGYFTNQLIQTLFQSVIVIGPVTICSLIANSSKFKEKTKFLTKHRGIMHTLVPPVGILFGALTLKIEMVQALLFGIAFGYLSHLLADCMTKSGCPLLYPISKKSVRLLRITTGTVLEYFISLLLMGGIVWTGYWLGR